MTDLNGSELTRFLFAITVLLAAAHSIGSLFEKLRMPRVIGELTGGMLLGPTVLGWLAPGVHAWLFTAFPAEGKLIGAICWIGLALLMFISGFEMQRSLSRGDLRLVLSIVLGATSLCLLAGWFLYSAYDFSGYFGVRGHELAFRLVLAIAIAVTSIPVISKIFIDLDIIQTRFAKIVVAAATVEDVMLWAVLAVATALAQGTSVSVFEIGSRVAITLAFFGVALFAAPALLRAVSHRSLNAWLGFSPSGFALLMCFLMAAVASVLNVNLVFGAFVAGILLGTMPEQQLAPVKKHIKDFSLAFFIPIYFAVVGLKLGLIHHFDLLPFVGFIAFATVVKAIGTAAAASFAGEDWRSSINFGIAMNARGGPGIVLASIGLEIGIINESFFSILVMTAVLTSLGAGYWLKRATMRHTAWMLKETRI